jgi:hypothetical protein
VKKLVTLAATVALLSGVAQAQTIYPPDQSEGPPNPGWSEFRDLSDRLNRVEAENRWLRNEVFRSQEESSSVVKPAAYCDSRGPVDCGCDTKLGGDHNKLVQGACPGGEGGLCWNLGPVRVTPFGSVTAEMIGSQNAYALLGAPLFLLPAVPAGVGDSRFTVSGQQTTLGFNISAPDCGGFQSGANIAFNFFGDRPVQNNPGLFFLVGYVELKNEYWRFWAGQDPDSLGRQNSNSPSWTAHRQSGNFGQIRPGFRAERFLFMGDSGQTSIYVGLTQQVVLDLIANQRSRNEAYWANAIWKMSEQWETRFEVSRQKTDYIAPSVSSRAMLYHFLVRYNF